MQSGEHVRVGLRPHERRIGEGDHDVAAAAGDRLVRCEHGVSRPAPLVLHEAGEGRRLGCDVVAAGSDDQRDRADAGRLDRGEAMGQHRTPGDVVQDLRTARAHPSPFAGRQDDGQAGSVRARWVNHHSRLRLALPT